MLTVSHVSKSYPGAAGGDKLTVLRDVSFTLSAGESAAVTGPSGCGKSTLLHLVGALDRPDSGSVSFEGAELSTLDEAQAAAFRNRSIGFIFQNHALLPQCTALENVLVPVLASRAATAEDTARARELLGKLGLAGREHHRPAQLSGGENQRVAVARALILRPRLLLADEPTGSLDEAAAGALTQLLLDLNRDLGTALLVVTHSPDVAARMGRTLRLRGGRLE